MDIENTASLKFADVIQEYLAHHKKVCCDVFSFVKIECFSVEGENDVKTIVRAQDVFSMGTHRLEKTLPRTGPKICGFVTSEASHSL